MRVRAGVRVVVGLAVAATAVVAVPVRAASALPSITTETYDAYANGGSGQQIATSVTTFTLDGISYTTDQPSTTYTGTLSSGATLSSGPGDAVLVMNYDGTPMTSVTIKLANGDPMSVRSFDLDGGGSTGSIEVLPDGNVANEVTLPGSISGSVDLSANPNFVGITTLELLDVNDGFPFLPTLNNLVYEDLNSPPQLTASGGSTSFVAGDNTTSTPVAVDGAITLTDGDSSTASSATASITGNFDAAQDVLAFTNTSSTTFGNISGSYNATTGVLTLNSSSATATIAQWQAALRAVTYTDTAVTPNTATRTVSSTLNDGLGDAGASNTVTKNVTVTDTDQTPIVTTTGGTTTYVGGAAAATVDGGISVSDLDNTTQSSATVSVDAGFHSGDTLGLTNDGSTMGNIVGSYNAATGVLTLTSSGATAIDAQWANALSAVTFSSSSTTYGNRTIGFATSDGTKTSSAATDTVDVLAPLTITTDSGSAAFVAGDNTASTPVVVDSGLTVTDGATSTLDSATVAITGNLHSGEDVLAFTNDGSTMGNISGSYNAATGVLTLTSAGSTATRAQWQSALESVTYTDTAVTPNNATRTVSFTAVDSLANTSNTATRTVTVTDTDQTPIVTTTGGATNYVAGTTAVTIDSGITVSDLDNTTQSSATVSIGTGFHSGDALGFVNTSATTFGNVVGSYNSATGVLTLTSSGATATDAQWADAVSAVTFSSSSTTYGTRTIGFATSDGTKTSSAATDTVDVLGPPTITTDSGSAAFVAGDNTASTPVVVDSGLAVADGSSTALGSTTVAITGNFHAGEDVLAFMNDGSTMGNIAAAYNATTGVMTLTSAGATATLAQWQSALESVTYTDTAVTPNSATRTVSFTAVDGGGTTSNTATRTVTVTDTDQTPIVTTTGSTLEYVSGSSSATVDSGVVVSDGDNTTQSSATVSITAGFSADDTLAFTNTSATTLGNITGSYNAASGVLTLTSAGATATDAQWANALSAVTFNTTSTTYGNRTVSFATSDGTKTSSAVDDTVDVKAPVVASPPAEPPVYPGITRVAGPDRIATAIAASEHEFPGPPSAFTANAVVLVDANDYIDGLTGAPLAAAVRAPLLFTNSDAVPASVLSEIHRLLGSSGTVYVLGGTAAIPASVETQLQGSGYTPQRIAGADRYATAIAIADMVARVKGTPSAVFEVSGLGYADALTAAPAAARAAGVVLLTVGDSRSTATADWIAGHLGIARYAVGGQAAAADPGATAISGLDRYATAVDVAARFFSSADTVSLAGGVAWPDAAVAAVNAALGSAPLLLVTADALPSVVTSWFETNAPALTAVTAYGGSSQISSTVLGSIATMTGLPLA